MSRMAMCRSVCACACFWSTQNENRLKNVKYPCNTKTIYIGIVVFWPYVNHGICARKKSNSQPKINRLHTTVTSCAFSCPVCAQYDSIVLVVVFALSHSFSGSTSFGLLFLRHLSTENMCACDFSWYAACSAKVGGEKNENDSPLLCSSHFNFATQCK